MTKYTVGFLFGKKDGKDIVWLINKNKPDWQIGKLNGIGGKIEYKEPPMDAMIREFKEEAGVDTKEWVEYCELSDFNHYRLHCFKSTESVEPKTMTDEVIGYYEINNLPDTVLPSVKWLIPMALNSDKLMYRISEKPSDYFNGIEL